MPRASVEQWRRSTTPSASVLRPGVGRYRRFHSRPGAAILPERPGGRTVPSPRRRHVELCSFTGIAAKIRAFRTSSRARFRSSELSTALRCVAVRRARTRPPIRRRAGKLCGGEFRGHQRQLIGQVVQHVVAVFPKGRHLLRRSLRTRAICWAAWEEKPLRRCPRRSWHRPAPAVGRLKDLANRAPDRRLSLPAWSSRTIYSSGNR